MAADNRPHGQIPAITISRHSACMDQRRKLNRCWMPGRANSHSSGGHAPDDRTSSREQRMDHGHRCASRGERDSDRGQRREYRQAAALTVPNLPGLTAEVFLHGA